LNTLPMDVSQYHMENRSLTHCSVLFIVLSRISWAPVEPKRVIPFFCPSSCANLSGVTTYLTAGAIPLREVRTPSVVRRVDSGVSISAVRYWIPCLTDRYWGKCGQLGIRRCGCCSDPLGRGESVTSGSLGPSVLVCLRILVSFIECSCGF
jgi:hypothetical protein